MKFIFFVTAVVAVCLGQVHRVGRQRRFAAAIESLGGEIFYDYQFDGDGNRILSAAPPGPAWLRRWVGDDYFTSIGAVNLQYITEKHLAVFDDADRLRRLIILFVAGKAGMTDDAILRRLSRLKRLECLSVQGNFSASGLEALASLKDLRQLYVNDNHFTDSEKDRLWQLMPECEIHFQPIRHPQFNYQVNRELTRSSGPLIIPKLLWQSPGVWDDGRGRSQD